jgi:hypothetical protein
VGIEPATAPDTGVSTKIASVLGSPWRYNR